MSSFDLAAVFMGLVAAIGWLNAKVMRLPPGVAMLLVGLAGAALVHVLQIADPGFGPSNDAHRLIGRVDFSQTVVGYMLAFLLFAGGMQVDLGELRRRLAAVFLLSTVGVLASTALVGFGAYLLVRAAGLPLPLPWAFVFGALISPTDPIAVLSTVRSGRLSKSLRAILQGEALFNDGVGIVIFLAALAFAGGGATPTLFSAVGAVSLQAVGGLALGLIAGLLIVWAMRAIDDYAVEIAISIALAAGVYAAGQALHVSGAIAAVAAGLIVGDHGVRTAMSDTTRRYLQAFWRLIDEILNALLFLLLGLELLVLPFDLRYGGLWLAIIALVIVARFVTVLPWGAYFHLRHEERGASLLLTWGGLRGALSLALALDVPNGAARPVILSLTYAVVVFAVVVQGLSFGPLVRALGDGRKLAAARLGG
jgi:CPA1 family monovalent cation:H+ antiporter